MRILIEQPTNIGTFYLGQSKNRKYHPIFNDTSLGEFNTAQEAVDFLIDNKDLFVEDPETQEKVYTSTLDIPRDYTHWDSIY